MNGCEPSHAYRKQFFVELLEKVNECTLPLWGIMVGQGAKWQTMLVLSCSHLQAILQRLPTAMTPIYPEGFIQIVPFAPFAAEIFNLMGTALAKFLQCSLLSSGSPDGIAWPEVCVRQLLVIRGVNIPDVRCSIDW